MSSRNGCRIIYTDGSVVEGRAAAAMVEADVDGGLDIRAWPFSCLAESFEAEREAIRAACEKVASSACPNRSVLILTDSLSNIDALESPKYRDAEAVSLYQAVKNAADAVSAGGGWLEIRWVRGHDRILGNHIADGACGEITDDERNFDGLSSTITHRGVKREILRGRRSAKEQLLRQQTKYSATAASVTSTTGGKSSAAYKLPITKQLEATFIRAQLDLLDSDWNGDYYPCLNCAAEPMTTCHLFRECPAWAETRAELGVNDEEALWRNPVAASELLARWEEEHDWRTENLFGGLRGSELFGWGAGEGGGTSL